MLKSIFLCLIGNSLMVYSMSGQDTIRQIIYKPIGVFHTSFTPETGVLRQGMLMPETRGTIEIYPAYRGNY